MSQTKQSKGEQAEEGRDNNHYLERDQESQRDDARYGEYTDEIDIEMDKDEDFLGYLRAQHGSQHSEKNSRFKSLTAAQVILIVDGVRLNLSPIPIIENGATLIPIRAISTHFGAGVWWNGTSKTVGINKGDSNISFIVGATSARVNGKQINVPPSKIINNITYVPIRFISEAFGYKVAWDQKTRTVRIDTTPNTYTVVAGDSLWGIANRFGMTVDQLRQLNNLTSDVLRVGQTLILTGNTESNSEVSPPTTNQGVTKRYTTHTVQSGDNAWNLSIRYGIPMLELLQTNNMSINHTLHVGQILTVPVYSVPVKPARSSRHGEFLDWWTEARYVFPIGKEAVVTDFSTGRTFNIRHTMGGNHADCEPLTAADAEVMRQVWGGSYSWVPRAVIITVDGRRLAAAMHSYPHADAAIKNNNYPGHFCVHFLNSTRHNDGLVQASMQTQIRISAGTS